MELKTIQERTQSLFEAESKTMDLICRHIASGGTMTDLCGLWQVPFGDVSNWVHKDAARSKRYNEACNDRVEWAKDIVFAELRKLATSDIRKIYDDKGNIKPVHEWSDDVASFVASIDQVEEFEGKGRDKELIGYVKKVKLWNKEKCIELLGKTAKMFTELREVSGKVTLEDIINGSRDQE